MQIPADWEPPRTAIIISIGDDDDEHYPASYWWLNWHLNHPDAYDQWVHVEIYK